MTEERESDGQRQHLRAHFEAENIEKADARARAFASSVRA